MMKGAIDFLTDETSEEAEILRQNFVVFDTLEKPRNIGGYLDLLFGVFF